MGKKIINMFKNEKGLTLIEVLISIVLLSLIAMTFLNVFLTAFDNSIKAQEITNYTYATQAVIEELRADDYGALIKKKNEQLGKAPFDINGDGQPDCYMEFTIQPYGVMDKTSNGKPGAFVHIIYLVDKVLVIDGDGNLIYTSATANPTITLFVEPSGVGCYLTVNGEQTVFSRLNQDRHICVMTNLNYKDLGYNNNLVVTGDIGHVFVKKYGNEVNIDEFTASVTTYDFIGINNLNSSIVKINVFLYREEDDETPFFDMSEIVEVSVGDRDSLDPET